VELGFLQLKPTLIYQDNSCVVSAHNVHLRGRSTQVALLVYFMQQLIQDRIISAKQCQMLCLEYLSNPSQISLLVTGTLAANDFHSALPTPMRLLKYSKCLSWSRLCMCFVILLMCHICCVLAYSSLSSFKARGGARNDKVLGFSVLDDSILYTCLLLKHVISRIPLTI